MDKNFIFLLMFRNFIIWWYIFILHLWQREILEDTDKDIFPVTTKMSPRPTAH